MKLKQAFELVRGDVVAFIGAGGKTSLMVSVGYELAEAGWRVLATTTTHLSEDQLALFPATLPSDANAQVISQALSEKQFVLLHDEVRAGRVYGPTLEWTRQLLDSVDSDVLLVEADDAGGLPFKAPFADEPRIPLETSLVIATASLSALGAPLDKDHVYNPQAMIDKYGFVENSPVKSPWLAQVLRDEELGLRGVPQNARVLVFLNQTPERGYARGRARMIARLSLQSKRISAVALGSVRGVEPVHELQRPVGALVLAAGNSPSQDLSTMLQPWERGQTALARVTEQIIRSRIDHIRVVTGHGARDARQAIKHLGVKVAHNRSWKSGGFISSLKAGLESLPDHVAAVLAVPGDQARIQPKTIYQVLSLYARCDGDFLIPRYRRRSGYPVLIGRNYWAEILKMPRHYDLPAIAEHFGTAITFLDVDSNCILRDCDIVSDHRSIGLPARVRSRGS
jgi:probable selenium-dependent hydroxylase accessory protein YqeC